MKANHLFKKGGEKSPPLFLYLRAPARGGTSRAVFSPLC